MVAASAVAESQRRHYQITQQLLSLVHYHFGSSIAVSHLDGSTGGLLRPVLRVSTFPALTSIWARLQRGAARFGLLSAGFWLVLGCRLVCW